MNKVRAVLINSNLPAFLWGEAYSAVVYLYNRTPHTSLNFKTPYELKTTQKPDISNIRVWGSITYRRMPDELISSKIDPRAKAYYLIGYGSNQYKLLDLELDKVVWSRDVKILENTFRKIPTDTL
jgi:hypothetical protein